MKHFVFFGMLLLWAAAHGQSVDRCIVYFDYAKADLTPEADSILSALALKLKAKEAQSIEIRGHTDADGSNAYNQLLSQKRAEQVQQYFVAVGVAATKIKLLHFGESSTVVANTLALDKQRNRRVEIVIKYGQSLLATGNAARSKTRLNKPQHSIARLPAIPKELIQRFTSFPQKEIIIQGKQGTTIKFEANSFVTGAGTPVIDEVTIELIEIYSKPEIIATLLHTVSDQNLLETNGMIHLIVRRGNEVLALKAEGFYQVEFPTATRKQNDMAVFYGETDPNSLNWKQAPRNWSSDFTYIEDQKTLDKYIFNSSKLDWVNCDRFVNKRPLTSLSVTANDTTDVNFCLVFKSLKSVMNVSSRRGSIDFRNVPVGEVAAVVAFKKTSRGIYYASKRLVIQANQPAALTLEKLTDKEFKARIGQFQ